MNDVVYRLTWFELQVCPQNFRLAVVPEQPILIDCGGEDGLLLVPYEGHEATFEGIIDTLDELVRRWRIFETEMHHPDLVFEDEDAMSTASLHLRFAYGDETWWASMYPLHQVPTNMHGLLKECQQMASEFFESAHSEEVPPEKALSLLHPAETARPPAVIIRVKVASSGKVFLNGRPTNLNELVGVLARLKNEDGGVWYHREDPAGEQPEEAKAVFETLLDAGLPIKLCEKDFDSPDDAGEEIFVRPQ